MVLNKVKPIAIYRHCAVKGVSLVYTAWVSLRYVGSCTAKILRPCYLSDSFYLVLTHYISS